MWYFSVSWCVDHFTIVSKQGFSHLRIENIRKIGQFRKEIDNEKDMKIIDFSQKNKRVSNGLKYDDRPVTTKIMLTPLDPLHWPPNPSYQDPHMMHTKW